MHKTSSIFTKSDLLSRCQQKKDKQEAEPKQKTTKEKPLKLKNQKQHNKQNKEGRVIS
jgi:hypothetical protein